MAAILPLLRETFIRPFRNRKRAAAYIGLCLGVFGYDLILVAVPLSHRDAPAALLSFYLSLFVSYGLLFLFLYPLQQLCDGRKWRIGLITAQAMGFIALLAYGDNMILAGAVCAGISGVFWGLYHMAMCHITTDKHRGYEVVLGNNLVIIAVGLATGIGVYLSQGDNKLLIMVLACLTMLCSNFSLLSVLPFSPRDTWRNFKKETRAIWKKEKHLLLHLFQQSLLTTGTFFLSAALHFLGYSFLQIGGVVIVSLALQTLLSPFIGRMVQKRNVHEYLLGFFACALGWLLLYLAPPHPVSLVLFTFLNLAGLRLVENAINAKLYAVGHYGGLLLSEMVLLPGRVILTLIMVPLLYSDARSFALLVASILIILTVSEVIILKHGQRSSHA